LIINIALISWCQKLQILKTLTIAQDTRYLRQADDLASQQDIEQFLKYSEDPTFDPVPGMPDKFRGTFQGQAVIYKRLPKTADDRGRVLDLRRHLAVLRTLSNFDYVQKFYGLVLRSEDDGQYTYAIMEDVRQPLVDVLGSLSAERKLNIAMQLASTIKSLHAGGVMHKGISCENVFLTEDLKPRLSGFEQSRKVRAPDLKSRACDDFS
jgi:serine/threonine protein kinase